MKIDIENTFFIGALKEIIKLTSNIEKDGEEVWGMDTNCGTIDELITQAIGMIKLYMRQHEKYQKRLAKKIKKEMVIEYILESNEGKFLRKVKNEQTNRS